MARERDDDRTSPSPAARHIPETDFLSSTVFGCDGGRLAVSSMTMAVSATHRIVVGVVIVALMLFCLGDVVHAFMPFAGENAGCDGRFCSEQDGCGTGATFKPAAPPIVTVTTPAVTAPPLKSFIRRQTVEPFFVDLRPAAPLAPRSPPSA